MASFHTTVFRFALSIYVAAAAFALFSTAKALLLFAKFVSSQTNVHYYDDAISPRLNDSSTVKNSIDESKDWKVLCNMLVVDLLLLGLFILQHSLMACRWWKNIIHHLGLEIVERSLYVISTSYVLQVMIENWQYTNSAMLWYVDTENSTWLWLTFTVIHVLGWTLILGSTLLMDVCELVGVKQVYYFALGLESPISQKSSGLQRFYSDMRHPGAVSLTLMLLIHPHMTASRAMLSLILVLYCMFRFNVDKEDHSYLQQKMASKEDELNTMISSSYQRDEMSVQQVWRRSFQASN